MMCLIAYSKRRLFIDSFPQHAAAALSLPSVVTWVSNSPDMFGYSLHKNIVAKAPTAFRHYPDSYLEKIDITGNFTQDPYDSDPPFSSEEILKALE